MPAYAQMLLPGGRAYLTGILTMLRQNVLSALGAEFSLIDEDVIGEWSLMTIDRGGQPG